MSTPHDDDAPPAHEPDCLPPEPCVCGPKLPLSKHFIDFYRRNGLPANASPELRADFEAQTAAHDITTADLDALDRDLAEVQAGQAGWGVAEQRALKLLPRLARAYRRVCEERDSGLLTDDLVAPAVAKAEADAYARGRREAVEEAARYLREVAEGKEDSVIDAAADWIEMNERARGSK